MTSTLTFGPWRTDTLLYVDRRSEKHIYTVSGYSDWVIKVRPHTGDDDGSNTQELTFLNLLRDTPVRHSIVQPKQLYDAWGLTKHDFWYAMRRYNGSYSRRQSHRWRDVARCTLAFLEDLHRRHGLLHMDIKKENILDSGVDFVVADYELVTRPRSGVTCEMEPYDRWYYMRYGAEWAQPVRCWRMDLTMLGYLLADITWDYDNKREMQFPRECTKCMEEDDESMYYTDIIAMRTEEIQNAHPDVCAYLEIVGELPWNPWMAPPSSGFYRRLLDIFKD